MAKTRRSLVVVVLVTGICGPAVRADAQDWSTPLFTFHARLERGQAELQEKGIVPPTTVIVQILASPGIDTGILSGATAIVERVYQAFGVRLYVSDGAEPAADGRTPWRRIVVKPSAAKEFPAAFGTSQVMGISPRNGDAPGRIAYVFYDAVSQKAKRHDLPVFVLLGYTMAHELGHLLLPPDAHGATGVMRGNWDSNDMKMMRRGNLTMADRETALMRAYLDSLER